MWCAFVCLQRDRHKINIVRPTAAQQNDLSSRTSNGSVNWFTVYTPSSRAYRMVTSITHSLHTDPCPDIYTYYTCIARHLLRIYDKYVCLNTHNMFSVCVRFEAFTKHYVSNVKPIGKGESAFAQRCALSVWSHEAVFLAQDRIEGQVFAGPEHRTRSFVSRY